MPKHLVHNSKHGQAALEYLLLLGVVAVVVIASFGPGSLIDKIRNSAGDYYNTVSTVIMDSDAGHKVINGQTVSVDTPNPINGGWCPVAFPTTGAGVKVLYRACECPPPAFGGKFCSGNGNCPVGATCEGPMVTYTNVTACGSCPVGEDCLANGKCGCSDGLTCPANSSPDPSCSQCDCNLGAIPVGSTCQPCAATNGQCTTSTGSGQCFAAAVPPNMNCNTANNSFQCNTGTIFTTGPGCTPCAPTSAGQCTTSNDGKACVVLKGNGSGGCATNMYCDMVATNTTYNSCQCDEDPANNFFTYWDGTQCKAGAENCDAEHLCNSCTSCVAGTCQANSSCVIKS